MQHDQFACVIAQVLYGLWLKPIFSPPSQTETRPRGYKTFSMLDSAEHGISVPSHVC